MNKLQIQKIDEEDGPHLIADIDLDTLTDAVRESASSQGMECRAVVVIVATAAHGYEISNTGCECGNCLGGMLSMMEALVELKAEDAPTRAMMN